MNKTDWAYIAGFFDGEGCISVFHPSLQGYQLRISITQVRPEPLRWIKDKLEYGYLDSRRRQTSNFGSTWMYRITKPQFLNHFIKGIKPFTILKYDQLLLGEEFLSLWTPRGARPIPQEILDRRAELKQLLQDRKRVLS